MRALPAECLQGHQKILVLDFFKNSDKLASSAGGYLHADL
jgi:hypothetical protein